MMDMLSKRNVPESSSHGLEAWSQDGFNLLVSKLARLFLPFTVTPADQCIFGILEGIIWCSLRWRPNIQGKDGSVGKSKKPREAVVLSIMEDTLRVQFVGNKYLDLFQMGSLEVRMRWVRTNWWCWRVEDCNFQQSWKYRILIDAVLYKKITRHLPTMMNTRLDATHTLKIIKCPKCSAENVQLPFSLFSTP